MVTYIYFVKCPNCEDEHFDFFDEAKEFALGCLSQKPIITQTEVCRNDFGECTDSADLGTVWSWEDMMKDAEPEDTVFSKDETFGISEGLDDFGDFDIGSQIDEFSYFGDDLIQTDDTNLWVAENLAGGDIIAACWADSESAAYNLLAAAFCERTGKDTRDCYIYQAETSDVEYIHDNPELLAESRERVFIKENFATKQFEIPNFDMEIVDEFEDDNIKGYNIIYSKNGTDIAEVEVWETDSPVTVNANLHTPNLMQKYYSSFDDFASDLAYKVSRYVRVRESADRKPIPEGMTIEELVEAMEENEDTVECTKCGGLFEKATCTHNPEGFGWCCTNCEPANTLTEDTQEEYDLATLVRDSIGHLTNDLGKDPWADDFTDDVIVDLENNFDIEVPEDPIKYRDWCSAVASEVSRQVNRSDSKLEELEEAATYRTHLDLCPECGAENAFDHETGFCINCGFNL